MDEGEKSIDRSQIFRTASNLSDEAEKNGNDVTKTMEEGLYFKVSNKRHANEI